MEATVADMVPYNPDGTPVLEGGRPFAVPPKRSEARQLLTLTRMAWATRKGVPQPPPEGATVRIGDDPEPAFRYERVPVTEDGEVVSTELVWVDLRVRRREEEEARHLEAAKRAHAAAKRAKPAALTPDMLYETTDAGVTRERREEGE